MKIMPDCLGPVEKVPGYLCYSFQHFVSRTVATGKTTHKYMINQRPGFTKKVFLLKKSNYQVMKDILDVNKQNVILELRQVLG